MSDWLLLVALGPVQDFIAQARRTRDLWFGSHLLSELSRAAALVIARGGGELVFPALVADDRELAPCDGIVREDTMAPPLNVANKVLAIVRGREASEVQQLAVDARLAANLRLRRVAAEVRRACAAVLAPGIDGVWNEQIGTLLEFQAVWEPYDGRDYPAVRRAVEGRLAGRKNLRDFDRWIHDRVGAPKSSLDGARVSVLADPRSGAEAARILRKYRVRATEQLDAVGLVKRAGADPRQFIPLANIALAAWIDEAWKTVGPALHSLSNAAAQTQLGGIDRGDIPWSTKFGYDAQVFFRDRWRPVFEGEPDGFDPRAWGAQHVLPVLAGMKDPHPYVACIVADGDGMGATLDQLDDPDAHRRFSERLARFAVEARDLFERGGDAGIRGVLAYAGGDDVLAFVTVPDALAAAQELKERFDRVVEDALLEWPKLPRPTLSVGIGIGHILESLGTILELGREAESVAKGARLPTGLTRNALAVVSDKRSGGKTIYRARWPEDPVGRLGADRVLLAGPLSHKKVYEVRRALTGFPVPSSAKTSGPVEALRGEVTRILARSGVGTARGRGVTPDLAGLSLTGSFEEVRASALAWCDRMLIARLIDEAGRQAAPRSQLVPGGVT